MNTKLNCLMKKAGCREVGEKPHACILRGRERERGREEGASQRCSKIEGQNK